MKTPSIYDHQTVEAKWQQTWAETNLYQTPASSNNPTFYCLEFFPYPSGNGLSVGHGRNYIPTDVIARYHRMKGFDVLHPMGWDAFGLPAENEAIKRGVHPRETTNQYAANYRRQLTLMGCSYDWEREINSSDPEFYRWTQWFFLMLYQRGLAYQDFGQQWYCDGCKTVLANEQVEADGTCWRCHQPVQRRDMKQWYFRITAYADALLADLDTLDWSDHIITMQRNWIGRSEGVRFHMNIADSEHQITVYTTRPDTVFGMTFAVLAPEHPLVKSITTNEQQTAVTEYCEQAAKQSELARIQGDKQRDGVFTGAYAINPVNNEPVPIYVADYVLMGYGTGAIMAVPAHDERDFYFATRYELPIRVVISPPNWDNTPLQEAYTGEGNLINAGQWNGLSSDQAISQITDWFEDQQMGQRQTNYRMRDWLISRQRYWGAPIPIIHCDGCGTVPVPEQDLPVILPHIDNWEPGDDGQSPLANISEFVQTTCPNCGNPARRETDTMDGFACSSWYALRFVSPDFHDGPFDPKALQQWGSPDVYVGGAEHATMHLLYARFWTKVMADAGIINFNEPYPRLRNQGMMGVYDPETGQTPKMSKSGGNVVTPDHIAETHGVDALRIYLLFMAPFENSTVWEESGINGTQRFIQRVWRFVTTVSEGPVKPPTKADEVLTQARHRFVKQVTEQVEAYKFNTAISALMTYLNTLNDHYKKEGVTPALVDTSQVLVLTLAPFAPHISEELWQRFGKVGSIHQQDWPTWDESKISTETFTLIVQVNGKVRDRLTVPATITEDEAKRLAAESEIVQPQIADKQVKRIIYVAEKLVNFVIV
ncbi:MAG: leucine--tRNA ligase [Chloroflexota bacterium]